MSFDDEEQTPALPDAVQFYLNEIGRTPLLKAEEEAELTARIERGRAAEYRLEAGDVLTVEVRAALQAAIIQGQAAREHLIQANLRLVVSIAKKYVNRGLPFLDLVQEGNIGLMRAVEKFDPSRGLRFTTYATHWIRQGVTRAIHERGKAIRQPVHMSEWRQRLRKVAGQLCMELEREPTIGELAAAMGEPEERTRRFLLLCRQTCSLDRPVGEDGDSTMADFIPVPDADTERAVFHTHLHEQLAAALAGLTDRERSILSLRFGLADGQKRTLEEVGAAHDMTRERARQIEKDALRKLRHPHLGEGLRGFLGEL